MKLKSVDNNITRTYEYKGLKLVITSPTVNTKYFVTILSFTSPMTYGKAKAVYSNLQETVGVEFNSYEEAVEAIKSSIDLISAPIA